MLEEAYLLSTRILNVQIYIQALSSLRTSANLYTYTYVYLRVYIISYMWCLFVDWNKVYVYFDYANPRLSVFDTDNLCERQAAANAENILRNENEKHVAGY